MHPYTPRHSCYLSTPACTSCHPLQSLAKWRHSAHTADPAACGLDDEFPRNARAQIHLQSCSQQLKHARRSKLEMGANRYLAENVGELCTITVAASRHLSSELLPSLLLVCGSQRFPKATNDESISEVALRVIVVITREQVAKHQLRHKNLVLLVPQKFRSPFLHQMVPKARHGQLYGDSFSVIPHLDPSCRITSLGLPGVQTAALILLMSFGAVNVDLDRLSTVNSHTESAQAWHP